MRSLTTATAVSRNGQQQHAATLTDTWPDSSQACGVANFYRRDKFEYKWQEHRSRLMVLGMQLSCGQQLALVDVHLQKGNTECDATVRANQIDNMFYYVNQRSNYSRHSNGWRANQRTGICMVGDFNTGAESTLCSVIREEWRGRTLASAYEHPSAAATTPVVEATFAAAGRRYLIDQVWYEPSMLQLKGVLQPLTQNERVHLEDLRNGLPNMHIPSDHIPVGAAFEVPTDYS